MHKLVSSFESVVRRRKSTHYPLPTINWRLWRPGFTFIEILTVITIISVLAGIGYAKYDSVREKSMDAKRKGDLVAMKTALVSYYQDHETYPGNCAAPCTGVQAEQYGSDTSGGDWGIPNLSPEYIKSAPNDPRQSSILQTAKNLLAKLPKSQSSAPPQKPVNTRPEVASIAGYTFVASERTYTKRTGASYPPNPSSTETIITTGTVNSSPSPARSFSAGSYEISNGFIRWDTQNIPDNATITSAKVRINITSKDDADNRNLTADWYTAWPIDDTDYTNTPQTNAIAGYDISNLLVLDGYYNEINLSNANNTNISRTGYTGLRLHIDGGQPTGLNKISIHNSTYSPMLTVWYTIPSLPVIINPTATSITSSGAMLGANITSNGDSTLTARGTCWGTSAAPTTNCLPAEGGLTTGTFTQIKTGMQSNTAYFYRGYATNSVGTSYTTDGTFTTSVGAVVPDIKANSSDGPISISWNTSANLSWTSTNATSCSVPAGPWSGLSNPNQPTGNLTTSTTYTLSCLPGPVTDSVVINVGVQPSVTITATPSTMPWSWGGTGTISWNGTGVSTCSVPGVGSGGPLGSGPVGPLTTDITYTVTCDSGAATNSVTVTVGGAPAWTNACNEKDYIYCYVVSPDHLHFFLYAKLDRPKADDAIAIGSACETNKPTATSPKKPFNFCIEGPK